MDTIDLRSDTVTKPSAPMRAVMAQAEVGDDVYGEDPSILELERRVAALLGKEAAVWVPTGVMANQIALGSLAGMGEEIVCERNSHIVHYEGGAMSALWGAQSLVIDGPAGLFDEAAVQGGRPPPRPVSPAAACGTRPSLGACPCATMPRARTPSRCASPRV